MSLGAYVSGWFVKADLDLGRVVTNDVLEALASLPYDRTSLLWPDSDPANGEPKKGAVLVLVEAPDATHRELEKLPNNKVFPINVTSNILAVIQQFLAGKGIAVDLGTAQTRKEAAGRVGRALNQAFVDFEGADAAL